jgi:hypothetical protein
VPPTIWPGVSVAVAGWLVQAALGTFALAAPWGECRSDVCPGPSPAEQVVVQSMIYIWVAILLALPLAAGIKSQWLFAALAGISAALAAAVLLCGLSGSESFSLWPLLLPGLLGVVVGCGAAAQGARASGRPTQ